MRIMQTDRSETSGQVADALRREGHEIVSLCLPDAASPLTCQGLVEHRCPLDEGADLAITALEHPQGAPSAGTVCARRAGVPIVNLGQHDVTHPDLGAALARVAELGDDHVTATVQAALHRVLEDMGLPEGEVVLHRDATCERIIATVPGPLDDPTRSRIAVRLLDAATASGRHGRRRDVAVRTA
jgi:hypothetical protein